MIVADAGPLIGLAKIERLALLKRLAREVVVPGPVWHEVVVRGGDRPEVARIVRELGGSIREPEPAVFAAYRLQIDLGEAAALAVAALHPGALLLMDDARGRRLAQAQGFMCLGTLGLLVRAKRMGLVTLVEPEIRALIREGIFLGDAVVRQVLQAAGE